MDAEDHTHTAGSQLLGTSAKLVSDTLSDDARQNGRYRRRTMDVASSRRMPRELSFSLLISKGTCGSI